MHECPGCSLRSQLKLVRHIYATLLNINLIKFIFLCIFISNNTKIFKLIYNL